MSDPFIGEIRLFGGTFAPRGWSFCAGQLLPIANFSALFSLLGTSYGGDGRTTFGLPDLRGRLAVGAGGNPPGRTNRVAGQKSGQEAVTLTLNQLPSHTHAVQESSTAEVAVSSDPASIHTPVAGSLLAEGVFHSTTQTHNVENYVDGSTVTPDVNLGGVQASSTATVLEAGASRAHSNMQPWLCINHIIALEGTFPSRN